MVVIFRIPESRETDISKEKGETMNERFYLLVKEAGLTSIPEHRDNLHKFMELIVHECGLVADQTILAEGCTYKQEMRKYFLLDQ